MKSSSLTAVSMTLEAQNPMPTCIMCEGVNEAVTGAAAVGSASINVELRVKNVINRTRRSVCAENGGGCYKDKETCL